MTGAMMVHMSHRQVAAAPVINDPTLKLSYILDDPTSWSGSGTTITDKSGHGNHGTLVGSPTVTSTSIASNRVTPAYISCPYNLPTNAWTVRCIATMANPQPGYWSTMWANENYNATAGFLAYLTSSTQMAYGGTARSGTYISFTLGSKRLYDFTWDGTNFKMYVNSANVNTSANYATPAFTAATNNLYFGARHTNAGTGATDVSATTFFLMQVYSVALTSTQINTNYVNIRTQYGI